MAGESGLGAFAAALGAAPPDLNDPTVLARWLHRWSAEHPEAFWPSLWRHAALLADGDATPVQDEHGRFFPRIRLNVAENLIGGRGAPPDAVAVTACHADGEPDRLTRAELAQQVRQLAQALRERGVGEGDRVAVIPRSDARAVVAVLAVATVGASLALASPEMGAALMTTRFRPLAPRVLLAHAGPMPHDTGQPLAARVAQVAQALPSLEAVIVLDDAASHLPPLAMPVVDLFVAQADAGPVHAAWPRFPFQQPLFITPTAGADGQAEWLVHGAGGTLLEHAKQHRLHLGLDRGSVLFAPASVASVLWLWQLSALESGAGIVLYDGPVRDAHTLWRAAQEGGATVFVAPAPYLQLGVHAGAVPAREHALGALQAVLYTGMTLDESAQRWVRTQVAPVDLQAVCMSADLLGGLLLQQPGLALDDEANRSVGLGLAIPSPGARDGSTGELVCREHFPSRPLGFLDDPTGERFRATYLARHPGRWATGERIERGADGSLLLRGRVDGLMNVRGAQVSPAELAPLLREFSEIREWAVVEQQQPRQLGEGRAVLLLALRDGASLDGALIARMRRRFTEAASPAHVPDVVLQVPELPRLADGSVCVAALRDVVNDPRLRARPAPGPVQCRNRGERASARRPAPPCRSARAFRHRARRPPA